MTRLSNLTASPTGLSTERPARVVATARLAILWERVWRALWPASGIIGLFCAAAWLGLFAMLPGWLHTILLAVILFGVAVAILSTFKTFNLPEWHEGARRV